MLSKGWACLILSGGADDNRATCGQGRGAQSSTGPLANNDRGTEWCSVHGVHHSNHDCRASYLLVVGGVKLLFLCLLKCCWLAEGMCGAVKIAGLSIGRSEAWPILAP